MRRLVQLGTKSFDLDAVENEGCRITEKGKGYHQYVIIFGAEVSWLVEVMRRATRDRTGKTLLGRFQGQQDRFLEAWLLQNFAGKYISVRVTSMGVAHQICVPPSAFGDGWDGLARRLSEFVVLKKSGRQSDITYAQAASQLQWPTEKVVVNTDAESADLIVDKGSCAQMFSYLDCCLVGQMADWHVKSPSVEIIKEWVVRKWQVPARVEVIEFHAGLFVFGFPSRVEAERVLQQKWTFDGFPVLMRWWDITHGCYKQGEWPEMTWIRLVGLPLVFWNENVFKSIGEACGGFVQVNDETLERAHHKWARLLIKGNGMHVPSNVRLRMENEVFIVQIWVDRSTKIQGYQQPSLGSNGLMMNSTGVLQGSFRRRTELLGSENTGCSAKDGKSPWKGQN